VKRMGRAVSIATELGLTMGVMTALLVVGGLVLGRWVDGQLGSSPVGAVGGLLVGAILGQVVMLRMARNAAEEMRSADQRKLSTIQPSREPLKLAAETLTLMVAPPLVGFGIGYGASRLFAIGSLFTVVLVLVGVLVGLFLTVRYARR